MEAAATHDDQRGILAAEGFLLKHPSEELDGKVYQFSRNVALKILERAITRNIFDLNWRPTAINLLILLPAAKSLKRQTVNRLAEFLPSGLGRNLNKLRSSLDIVVNSASLEDNDLKRKRCGSTREFLDKLRDPAMLHLLVLDEFDWGAGKYSQLNNYLQEVIAVLKESPKSRLLFLPVSATPEMLLAPDDEHADFVVSIEELARNDPGGYFQTPSYKGIYDLEYRWEKPKHLKLADQSLAIATEYEAAITRLQNNEGPTSSTPADLVIRHLMENPDDLAVVRLKKTDHVGLIEEAHRKLEASGIQAPIFGFCNGEGKDIKYENKTGLLVVVQRCQRGDTISNRCKYYDVRGRYTRYNLLQLNTFKQDVGRCAGHAKMKATVLNCLFTSGDQSPDGPPSMSRDKLVDRCKTLHSTLLANGQRGSTHPDRTAPPSKKARGVDPEALEEDSKALRKSEMYTPVFKALKDSSHEVILCAEPQIGKTSVVLSLLRLLHELYFPENDYRKETNWPCLFEQRLDLIDKMSRFEDFHTYHETMHQLNRAWHRQNSSPAHQIAGYIADTIQIVMDYGAAGPFRVVDAGCVTCDLVLALREKLERGSVDVLALDIPSEDVWRKTLSDDVLSLIEPHSSSTGQHQVRIGYKSGDYVVSTASEPGATTNFLVFSMSLFASDIAPEVRMARRLLGIGSLLYIADSTRRFPDGFERTMAGCGFAHTISHTLVHDMTVPLYSDALKVV